LYPHVSKVQVSVVAIDTNSRFMGWVLADWGGKSKRAEMRDAGRSGALQGGSGIRDDVEIVRSKGSRGKVEVWVGGVHHWEL
jgi:hypothetical protein